jgi:hypothetical protein
MTTANLNKFNKFVISFLKENKNSENIEELWMNTDVQKQFKSLCSSVSYSGGLRKKNKDPNAPKRGKSGYLFFCAEHREAVKASLGESSKATDITKELGLRWNALKESKKPADKKILANYEKAAVDDKSRYHSEKANYIQPEGDDDETPRRRGGKRKSPKKGPKRARSAYLYFCEERRGQLKDKNPDLKSTEITSELGRLWNELKGDESRASELSNYESKAAEDKDRYESEKTTLTDGDKTKTVAQKKPVTPKKATAKTQAVVKPAPKKSVKNQEVEEDPVKSKKTKESTKESTKEATKEITKEPTKEVTKEVTKEATKEAEKKVNGYQEFCKQKRPELKAAFPNEKAQEITKKLSEHWKELSQDEQKKWSM